MIRYDSYFQYEWELGTGVVLPFLKANGISLDGKSVLDIGCGEGGVLAGLAEEFYFQGIGIDRDEDMIKRSKHIPNVRFVAGNFYDFENSGKYDFILLRDVLEHCGDARGMLKKATTLLSPEGYMYATYTPFLSPFGGHQHNGSSIFSNVPYLQFLPERLFLAMVRPKGNWYKGAEKILSDLKQIRRTWLTTGMVIGICKEVGLRVDTKRGFICRPDYRYKFGLPTIAMPSFVPAMTLTDLFSTCVEMLLHKEGPTRDGC